MPSNDSQATDALNAKQLVVRLSPKIPKAVRYACRFYGHDPNWDEVEDLSQDVLAKLIDDDCRRMRSFANYSSIETWLYTVVKHDVKVYVLKRRHEKENVRYVTDLLPDALSYQPTQEKTLIYEGQLRTLHAIIGSLSRRKRRLIELQIQELKPKEIAKEMGIKIDSFYSQKSAIIKEIRESIEGALI
ncbi:MAG: RNA polymerase sigma factor [Chloracidobacterium sp.]|nr:RNA polymerase sigma factor [Chloracidobacterium sp.]